MLRKMKASVEIDKELETRAAELGASSWTIAKWRARGIPPKWQIKLFGLKGNDQAPMEPKTEKAASGAAE